MSCGRLFGPTIVAKIGYFCHSDKYRPRFLIQKEFRFRKFSQSAEHNFASLKF